MYLCCHSYSKSEAVLLRMLWICFSALSVTSDVAWYLDALAHLACSVLDPSLLCSIKVPLITTATHCWYNEMAPDYSNVHVCMQKGGKEWSINFSLKQTEVMRGAFFGWQRQEDCTGSALLLPVGFTSVTWNHSREIIQLAKTVRRCIWIN